jgi:hypothetical protein
MAYAFGVSGQFCPTVINYAHTTATKMCEPRGFGDIRLADPTRVSNSITLYYGRGNPYGIPYESCTPDMLVVCHCSDGSH